MGNACGCSEDHSGEMDAALLPMRRKDKRDVELISKWRRKARRLFEEAPCSKRILLLGLKNAGKSTLLFNALTFTPELFSLEAYPYKSDADTGERSLIVKNLGAVYELPWKHVVGRNPTNGFQAQTCIWNNCYKAPDSGTLLSLISSAKKELYMITSWDTDGTSRWSQGHWFSIFQYNVGIIFMIDSEDEDKFERAREHLLEVCAEERLSGMPLLVLLNKSDWPTAVCKDACVKRLGIAETASFTTRHLSKALKRTEIGNECSKETRMRFALLIASFCFDGKGKGTLNRPVKVCSVSSQTWQGVDNALQWLFSQC